MQKRLKINKILLQPVNLDPAFPVSMPSHILRGEISPDPPHIHDHLEIGYCFEGAGIFSIDSKIIPYTTGDAVIINHREVHQAVSSFGKISIWSFFYTDPAGLLHGAPPADKKILVTDHFYGTGFTNVIKGSEHPEICLLIRDIICEMRSCAENYQDAARALILTMLIRLHRIIKIQPADDFSSADQNRLLHISPAIRYIADHFSEPLNIDYLARLCGLSCSHFRKIFRETAGIAPLAYLARYRMHAASIMLAESNRRIIDIAFSCGFLTLSSFNRIFLREYKISPRVWRKSHNILNSKCR
ncbi:MAG: hypothetical protein A2096_00085 [Spirochaetes bacterium GWF1_41_5]|nr:MAG: hypothetical protein A2096_00085 [Spirochaetes bacterium GWF1_41_5]HBE02592.1 hypothetical protein [Spirochaetia bacterium]